LHSYFIKLLIDTFMTHVNTQKEWFCQKYLNI